MGSGHTAWLRNHLPETSSVDIDSLLKQFKLYLIGAQATQHMMIKYRKMMKANSQLFNNL